MLDMTFADEFEDQSALFFYCEVLVLKRCNAVGFIMPGAFVGADADVKRVDEPHHYRQNLVAWKSFESDVLICHLTQLRQKLTELLDF